MSLEIDQLKDRLLNIQEESENIVKAAQAEGNEDLTSEQVDKLEALDVEFKSIERQIKNLERIEARNLSLTEGTGRQTDTDDAVRDSLVSVTAQPASAVQQARIRITEPPEIKRNNGFRSLGDFARSVKSASRGQIDPRLLRNAPTTYSTEGVGADGGYLVPPDYRTAILKAIMGEASLLARTDNWETGSNTLVIPADETTPWQTSGGILAYWESEAGQKTQSKMALKEKTVKLNKLTALIPVSEELLEDASSLDSYLNKKVPEKFDFKINLALVQGTGVGEPQGALNCPSLVTVSKESGQSADTIVQ